MKDDNREYRCPDCNGEMKYQSILDWEWLECHKCHMSCGFNYNDDGTVFYIDKYYWDKATIDKVNKLKEGNDN